MASSFNVNQFRANFTGDGARPNLFLVQIPVIPYYNNSLSQAGAVQNITGTSASGAPTGAGGNNSLVSFMAKSAQLPGSTLGTVSVPYFGREIKLPGNRTFADWTITIINDENFAIRSAFEGWMNGINNHVNNVRDSSALNPSSYTVNASVTQYDKTGYPIGSSPMTGQSAGRFNGGTYNFVGMFPIDISPISLDWGSNDTIEEFDVTFAYQYWTNTASTDA
jgi:hypothetical protein